MDVYVFTLSIDKKSKVSRCLLTQLVKYEPKAFLYMLVSVKGLLLEFTVGFIRNSEDEYHAGRVYLILYSSYFDYRSEWVA
jgi:hypothetical protein